MEALKHSMEAVEKIEADEKKVVELPGVGHNSGVASGTVVSNFAPPPAKQDVREDRLKRTREIHEKNAALPTVELATKMVNAQSEILTLNKRIGVHQSLGQEAVETAQAEYEIHRSLLEGELRDAKTRRDQFLATLNEEIKGIERRLQTAATDHDIDKGQIIRNTQTQIESMQETIARLQRFLGE